MAQITAINMSLVELAQPGVREQATSRLKKK